MVETASRRYSRTAAASDSGWHLAQLSVPLPTSAVLISIEFGQLADKKRILWEFRDELPKL